jgi:hypothetical protein
MIRSIANFESSEFFVNMGAKIWAFASDAVFLQFEFTWKSAVWPLNVKLKMYI